jgi:phosphoribosyl 1,2-cyclic phosphate phosphodiesterase
MTDAPPFLTDSHCHLDFPDFEGELPEIIARARGAGVHRMVTICTRLQNEPLVRAIAEANDGIFYAAGTHPMRAAEDPLITVDQLVAFARHPKFVGIGETGLDYHYTAESKDIQQTSLRIHIAAARQTGLPLIIHARSADEDMARILTEEYRNGAYSCVMHCFSSGPIWPGRRLTSASTSQCRASRPSRRARSFARFLQPPLSTGSSLKPTRPISRRRRIGAAGTNPPTPPLPPGPGPRSLAFPSPNLPPLPKRTSTGSSPARPPRQGRPRMATVRFTILGCGSSGGVPRIGNLWGDCDPNNPRNRRTRCSLLIERVTHDGTTRVLIDTSPDMRSQLIDAKVSDLDAVVYTHSHADHVHGIDDLRQLVFLNRRRLPVWADGATQEALFARFGYAFVQPEGSSYPPICDMHTIRGPFSISGAGGELSFEPFHVEHGDILALGFRCAGVAYLPDVSAMPDAVWSQLEGLDWWILDALRRKPHPTHIHLALALEWMARARPRNGILTNMHIDLDYETVEAETPPHIHAAYDGMVIEIESDG